ncbi:MAG: hypothetical protein A2Y95_04295 [Deltaproteobacteria bacterium RBG_13_65_10]|nr:MAG: hypothetical protein A2Y95_04295 [Deltaproteobacteria bacterium RBG_13_65_10]
MERRSGGGRERPEDRGREAQRSLIGRLPDMVKSMLVLSLGGVFMAEETLRKATRDLKLPREAIDLVMSQADRGKRELFDAIAIEVGRAIRDVDPEILFHRFARDFEIEIEGRIAFKPRGKKRGHAGAARPSAPRPLRIRVTSDKD